MGLQMTEKMQSEKWCVVSRLVWWFCTVSCFDKIILNQCACWGGSVLWQLFFWCHFFSSTFVNCFFSTFAVFSFDWKKNNYLMNTCNMFLNKKNNYRMPFYNPPQNKEKKNSTQTFFQRGPPSARLTCLLWWSSIVSSFFWSENWPNSCSRFLFLSFSKTFLFYFLISILLDLRNV